MDLKIFFDSVNESLFQDEVSPLSWKENISTNFGVLPNWKEAHLAIVGITESRGNPKNRACERGADEVRKKLYSLKKGTGSYQIVDLGNLRCGVKLEDTYLRVKEVCEILLEFNTFPILIGGGHDLDFGLYAAYEKFNRFISVLNVDAELDMYPDALDACEYHTHMMLVHEPNYLFHFANLAYQSYLNDPALIDVLEKMYFENIRLGLLKENIKEVEPIIRMADMLSFDIGSLKMQDAPGHPKVRPFGLTGEEACQITWYAGLNTKLSSAGFFEYNPDLDPNGQTAQVIATMIWYLVEGYYNRRYEPDFFGEGYVRYVISVPNELQPLVFYKSVLTEKWWMEVSFMPEQDAPLKTAITPCSYQDYLTASSGELPNRWIQVHAKLL